MSEKEEEEGRDKKDKKEERERGRGTRKNRESERRERERERGRDLKLLDLLYCLPQLITELIPMVQLGHVSGCFNAYICFHACLYDFTIFASLATKATKVVVLKIYAVARTLFLDLF